MEPNLRGSWLLEAPSGGDDGAGFILGLVPPWWTCGAGGSVLEPGHSWKNQKKYDMFSIFFS